MIRNSNNGKDKESFQGQIKFYFCAHFMIHLLLSTISIMNASLISTVLLPLALAIIMFGLGLALTLSDFKRIVLFPKAVFVGAVTQLVVLPALGFAIAYFMLRSSPE